MRTDEEAGTGEFSIAFVSTTTTCPLEGPSMHSRKSFDQLLAFYEHHLYNQVMPFWTAHCIARSLSGHRAELYGHSQPCTIWMAIVDGWILLTILLIS